MTQATAVWATAVWATAVWVAAAWIVATQVARSVGLPQFIRLKGALL
ncbi:unnamed protein product [Mycetohabitans rhizoxinica HKI 454]|uniref:Uncharacterized protein n=1 Tax=Mycetohabitans rhizoxinica (strain DSM 19002 / CIP 109453 / HKI 454) TaxID=882378 RepID=E5ALA9_MYCRK|nr:unnamed protein product [Mycetohabitans rhizoxinica HKI 454]